VLECVLFLYIVGITYIVAGFTATDTAKVSAERANLALRILPDSSSRIISMSYTDFPCPLRRYVCVFLTVK
jgi:hypothetical protein